MSRLRRAFIPVLASGGAAALTYAEQVAALFTTSLISYFPMNETSGTAAVNLGTVGTAGNGAYSGVTLDNGAFPSGGNAPLFGAGDYLDIYSVALRDAFSGAAGTLILWAKAENVSLWTDSSFRIMARLRASDDNTVTIRKNSTDLQVNTSLSAGATVDQMVRTYINGPTSWYCYGITWSKAADQMKAYYNGVQYGATQTGIGTWAGSLLNTTTLIGSFDKTNYSWLGWLSHVMVLNRVATPAEMHTVHDSAVERIHVTVLGDSIAAAAAGWAEALNSQGSGLTYSVINWGVSGHTIMANMDAQTVNAANGNADIIIINLGTNDNDAGDMNALQAEVEENIAELKLSNPSATIYYMNVLPRAAAKNNIRAAIAAACTAQSVTCWDTNTSPWFDYATETSDGVHPNAAGTAKILTQVLARI